MHYLYCNVHVQITASLQHEDVRMTVVYMYMYCASNSERYIVLAQKLDQGSDRSDPKKNIEYIII